ncbi:hypothetical protein GIS00_07555 [Nakamurella sp. YIM 132087]|uniref:NlpC/P60 domain-containing protein n=1 Tax=Nakamurella alba TaxID=2665158 RepID=A0A7K1FI41_9ACTN|nr:excalibur calcium-binding domain-containing protein [Nakamurella alba]MTD13797.1 hypothetical protein [Nakamurella alba]
MSTTGRRRIATTLGVMGSVLALMFSSAVAYADPVNPSDDDIAGAEAGADSAAAEVGRLAGQVTKTEGDIERLQIDMQLKSELVKKAIIDVEVADMEADQAKDAATAAAADAENADDAITAAESAAADFAAASYRQGSVLGSVTAFLDAGSLTDVLSREQLISDISDAQLDVIGKLKQARTTKVNLDSDARLAQQQAEAAAARAVQAKTDSQVAQKEASDALTAGQAQLDTLQVQLNEQQAAWEQALSQVSELKEQRATYEAWLAAKKAEEERQRKAAEAAAKKAAAEKAAAEKAAAEEAARVKAAAEKAAKDKAEAERKAAAELAAKKAAEKRALEAKTTAEKNAAIKAAQEAQARLATEQAKAKAAAEAAAQVYYVNCAEVEAAGKSPLRQGQPGYRVALDRNANGVACEVLADSTDFWGGSTGSGTGGSGGVSTGGGTTPTTPAAPTTPSTPTVYYASCAEAEIQGSIPIKKGEPGYRKGLDRNNNGIACETLSDSSSQYGGGSGGSGSGSGGSTGGSTAPIGGQGSNTGSTVDYGSPSCRGCTGSTAPGAWTAAKGQAAVAAALSWVGTPYSWGGGNTKGPTTGICGGGNAWNDCNIVGFDCSGLTSYAWAQVGISIPAYSVYQYPLGQHPSQSNLMPGDLLFYARNTNDPSSIYHVAMYIGNNEMVEAPYSGAYVQRVPAKINSNLIGFTRPGT